MLRTVVERDSRGQNLRADGRVAFHGRIISGLGTLIVVVVIGGIHRVDVVRLLPVVHARQIGVGLSGYTSWRLLSFFLGKTQVGRILLKISSVMVSAVSGAWR